MPSFILIHPTVWQRYTNVKDRQDRQTDRTDRQTDRTNNGLIVYGEPFYKRSPKKALAGVSAPDPAGGAHDTLLVRIVG